MGKECEFQFLDLDSTLEPKLTIELKVDFSELVFLNYHSWDQVNYSTKSHSFVGYRYRPWWLRDDFLGLVM